MCDGSGALLASGLPMPMQLGHGGAGAGFAQCQMDLRTRRRRGHGGVGGPRERVSPSHPCGRYQQDEDGIMASAGPIGGAAARRDA